MKNPERSIFEQAALASGLLSKEHLDRARRSLSVNHSPAVNQSGPTDDVELGHRLVELGYLNRWQVAQLLQGYTKFNLGAYKILDAIGKGGMGYVFKGEHTLLGRIEAIKVLPKDQSNVQSIAKFCHEIRSLARLDHPNLVRLVYADKDGETYFLVTEYVPGSNLRRLVRTHGPLSQQSAATIVSQAAEGLQHAHMNGLVHRDVKPGNLMVTPDGHTKLMDLGLAAFSTEMDASPTANSNHGNQRPNHIVGTPDFLAPEVIVSPEEVLCISDIYSLGCTLYYAVTGKVPFPGGETSDKLRCHLDELPIAPQRLNANLSAAMVEVIADMMRKRPEERVSTAAEVILRLQPLTESLKPSLLQEIGVLAQTPSVGAEDASRIADTTPVATDQLEPNRGTARIAKSETERVELARNESNQTPVEDVESLPAVLPTQGLGYPIVVLVTMALTLAIVAGVLALWNSI